MRRGHGALLHSAVRVSFAYPPCRHLPRCRRFRGSGDSVRGLSCHLEPTATQALSFPNQASIDHLHAHAPLETVQLRRIWTTSAHTCRSHGAPPTRVRLFSCFVFFSCAITRLTSPPRSLSSHHCIRPLHGCARPCHMARPMHLCACVCARRWYTYVTTGALPELVRCDDNDVSGCMDTLASATDPLDVIVLDRPAGSVLSHPSITVRESHTRQASTLLAGGHAIYPARLGSHCL